ncbi:MAG: type II toxin-antitoxin system RelE/ParE family toxin [Lachnospiraceae bacterium]|nr:type II toxin-antitoxin system RelE/ParE family toxin [Lachnospiraceae bacterium]
MKDKYELRYLPLFYEDLEQKMLYIAQELHNEQAAYDTLKAIETAILERRLMPEAFECYYSKKEREYPYYRIYVKNYVVFYVVIENEEGDKIMEVRRLLYNKQNSKRLV